MNGQPFCEACTTSIRQAHGDSPGGAAFGRALGAGVVAGAVGSSLYYLVAKISGYQLSIIAIAVGFLVGRAVRWATGGRGGVIYQVLAVILTYVAIAFSWVPFLVEHESGPSASSTSSCGPLHPDPAHRDRLRAAVQPRDSRHRPLGSLEVHGTGGARHQRAVRGRGARRVPSRPRCDPAHDVPTADPGARARTLPAVRSGHPADGGELPACHALVHAER